jgi:hypothetical protein
VLTDSSYVDLVHGVGTTVIPQISFFCAHGSWNNVQSRNLISVFIPGVMSKELLCVGGWGEETILHKFSRFSRKLSSITHPAGIFKPDFSQDYGSV